MNQYQKFKRECAAEIVELGNDKSISSLSLKWLAAVNAKKYSYHFEWLGRPIIQYPQDILAMQELIWQVKPNLIIETGIAHGGSLIFSASMLELNASCGGPQDAEVLGIDIDIRPPNRKAIETHPMFKRISMFQGSSIAQNIVEKVKEKAKGKQHVLICLDSNHTHDHVLAELEAYAPLTSLGSYCVVFDTVIDDLPAEMFPARPWGPGNNAKTAVREYMQGLNAEARRGEDGAPLKFVIDTAIDNKLLVSVSPEGYLRRV